MLSEPEIRERIARFAGPDRVPRSINLKYDTSDYFAIDYDDVVLLGDRAFLVRSNEREGRFGIDDEQKFWVKRVVDLEDGVSKIMKLTFHERFVAKVGGLSFECYRSPQKEARILDLVKGHERFMQGTAREDTAGNLVRIIERIPGPTLADAVLQMGANHEDYFRSHLPSVLDEFMELVRAIDFLHEHNEKHGDIRRDHIIKERATGTAKWIDFDYNYLHKERPAGYDLFGLGNVLAYLAGRGDVTVRQLEASGDPAFGRLAEEDVNIIFNNRVMNLKLVFPYMPEVLNRVLLHFSVGARTFYDRIDEFLADLGEARQSLT